MTFFMIFLTVKGVCYFMTSLDSSFCGDSKSAFKSQLSLPKSVHAGHAGQPVDTVEVADVDAVEVGSDAGRSDRRHLHRLRRHQLHRRVHLRDLREHFLVEIADF